MSPDELDALVAELRAGAVSPEGREARREAYLTVVNPGLGAAIAAAQEEERNTPPEVLAERIKRGLREVRKYERREARRMTPRRYHRLLRLQTAAFAIVSRRSDGGPPRTCARPGMRTPRSRRVVRRARARSPGRRSEGSDDPHEPADLAAGRCSRGHVGALVWRPSKLVPICAACLSEIDEALAMRDTA